MLIKSNFHDYYDGVQQYGADLDNVYLRYTKAFEGVEIPDLPCPWYAWPSGVSNLWLRGSASRVSCDTFIFGVCGVVSLALKVSWSTDAYSSCNATYASGSKMCYSFEELRDYMQKIPIVDARKVFNESKSSYFKEVWSTNVDFGKRALKEFFNNYAAKDAPEIFQQLQAPVWVFKRHGREPYLTCNPRLRDYNYASKEDPYTLYQCLSQYVGGVLSNQVQPAQNISDDVMRDKKGFNDKSFRKDPGVKKPRRRGKRRSKDDR